MRRITPNRLVGIVLVAGLLVACGDDAAQPPATDTISAEQSSRLAKTLFLNSERGAAGFSGTTPLDDGSIATVEGTVDWAAHTGAAHLASGTGAFDVRWTSEGIEDLEGERLGGPRYRLPDEQSYVDRLVLTVEALSSTVRDNPLLVQQGEISFEGTADIDGVTTEIFRVGDRVRLWVGIDDGELYRFESVLRGAAAPTVLDLRDTPA